MANQVTSQHGRFPVKHGRFPIKYWRFPINRGRSRPGGFDGTHDLDDLWLLSFVPSAFVDRSAGRAAGGPSVGAGTEAFGEVGATEFKIRRAAQAKALGSMRGASGLSYMPVHIRVWQAGELKGAQR